MFKRPPYSVWCLGIPPNSSRRSICAAFRLPRSPIGDGEGLVLGGDDPIVWDLVPVVHALLLDEIVPTVRRENFAGRFSSGMMRTMRWKARGREVDHGLWRGGEWWSTPDVTKRGLVAESQPPPYVVPRIDT